MLERVWRKGNPLTYSFGGNVNWCSHYGKQYEVSFKKKKKESPYDPAIPLLDIYPEKIKALT